MINGSLNGVMSTFSGDISVGKAYEGVICRLDVKNILLVKNLVFNVF